MLHIDQQPTWTTHDIWCIFTKPKTPEVDPSSFVLISLLEVSWALPE